MRKCIDISENKRITAVSPVAIFVWVAIFIALSAVMTVGLMYLICCFISYVFCIILFQYSPRFVFMSVRFLVTHAYLTPSFKDDQYITDETRMKNITKILKKDS